MYEHARESPISRRRFARRMLRQLAYAGALVLPSLALGTAVFRFAAGQSWHLAFLNAAMLLSGMGAVGDIGGGVGGSVAAALFALYAGLVFLVVAGLLVTPVLHRVLHHLHWESDRGRAGPTS
jgi:hypothetical protein